VRPTPPHPFAPENASDLTPFDLDPSFVCGLGQGIQAPLRRGLLVSRFQGSIPLSLQRPWSRFFCQGNDPAAFCFGETSMASRTRAVSQTIESLLIKTLEMDPYRFGTTLYFCCDGVDAHPIPTVHHHARSHDPIGGAMPTGG